MIMAKYKFLKPRLGKRAGAVIEGDLVSVGVLRTLIQHGVVEEVKPKSKPKPKKEDAKLDPKKDVESDSSSSDAGGSEDAS